MKTVLLPLLVLCCLSVCLAVRPCPAVAAEVPSGTRFTDNGDGTIIDNTTGLTWIHRLRVEVSSLKEALTLCSKIEYGAQKNWRLPTKDELVSLIASLKREGEVDVGFSAVADKAETMVLFWTSSLATQDPEKQGGLVLQNLGPNPFVQTVSPSGGVVIHGGAEGPGTYLILVRDPNTSGESKATDTKAKQE